MKKLLLIVEDAFQVSGRGVVMFPPVSPEVLGTSEHGHITSIEMVRPDKTRQTATAIFWWEFGDPGGAKYLCVLRDGTKEQVPLATEIWLND